jgi:hypothetical protein
MRFYSLLASLKITILFAIGQVFELAFLFSVFQPAKVQSFNLILTDPGHR